MPPVLLLLRVFAAVLGAVLATNAAAQAWRDDAAAGAHAVLPPGVRVLRDLHYGSSAAQTLDVYLPSEKTVAAPLIVMVHGGGWRFGDKAMRRAVDAKVARWVPRGIVFVSVGYGLLPDTPVARQVDDVAHAVAYVQHHAAEWGGDPHALILMGHSAGAHLAAMLGAAPSRAVAAGVRPWLGTVLLDSAALDVPRVMQRRHLRLYDAAFGADAAQWKALSPIDVLEKSAPPLLAVCSSVRADDSCAEAHAFAARAQALGVRAAVHEEPLTHGAINFTLGTPGGYTEAVESFMKSLDDAMRARLEAAP